MRAVAFALIGLAASGCGMAVTKTQSQNEKASAATAVQVLPPEREVYEKVAPMPREAGVPLVPPPGTLGGEGNDLAKE